MNWKTIMTTSHVPCPPEHRRAYDAAIRLLAELALQRTCEHEHTLQTYNARFVEGDWDETPGALICLACGKEMTPPMPEPIDLDQLADSQI